MKENEKKYCDTSRVSIEPIPKRIAKDMIVKNHYSHTWTMCRYALGVFYKMEEQESFLSDTKLIGCLVYGHPVGRNAANSISDELDNENVLELTRLYIDDGYGSNIESYSIAQSFKWIKENDESIKGLLSYADSGQHHLGKIYQATNWIYQGMNTDSTVKLMPNWSVSLTKNPYNWIHSRTVFSRWKSTNIEHLKNEIGKEGYLEFWTLKEAGKHRYIYFLGKDRREQRKLIRSLKHPPKPYPTESDNFELEITHYETYEPNTESNVWW